MGLTSVCKVGCKFDFYTQRLDVSLISVHKGRL